VTDYNEEWICFNLDHPPMIIMETDVEKRYPDNFPIKEMAGTTALCVKLYCKQCKMTFNYEVNS